MSPAWRALSKMGIPALFFINKTDREGADVDSVLGELAELTGRRPARVPLDDRAALAETLAEHDDAALEKYLDFGGIRLEDDLLITADGCRRLGPHRLPITSAEVEAAMDSEK